MRHPYLKIKIKSLAAEIKMIREAEQLVKQQKNNATQENHRAEHREVQCQLRLHRKGVDGNGGLRWEVRHSNLAYAFLRSVPYRQVEEKYHAGNAPDMDKIHKMVERFGGPRNAGEVEEWLEIAA